MRLSGGQLAGGNSTSEKAENDFYATDPKTVDLFMERALNDGLLQDMQNQKIWKCACGNGNIAEVLKSYFPESTIQATDLVDRGYGIGNVDFLKSTSTAQMIITNPPFSLMNDFIQQGLKLTEKYLLFFAKIQTLEGIERKKMLENCRWVSMQIQMNNKRNNHYITYNNQTKTMKQWAEELDINYSTLDNRLNTHKMSVEKALGGKECQR